MLRQIDGLIRAIFEAFVRFYQRWISPLFAPSCRFHPTCSSYSLTLFELTPSFYALFFSIIRIFKCNQFFKGGYDYPCIWISIQRFYSSPREFKYWIIPYQPLDLSLFVCKPIKIRAYIIKDL